MKSLDGALSWFEIPAANIERARRFYEALFGIEMYQITLGTELKMAIFPVVAGTTGGALCEHKEFYKPSSDGVLAYLNANPDLEVVLARVEENHGKILIAKTHISPELGYMAVFQDTEGNRLALMSAK